MTKKSLKVGVIGGLSAVFLFGLAIHNNILKLPIEHRIHNQYIADFSNDRVLMGASHNVFVGKVTKQIGTKLRSAVPETQFAVEVVYNIKGNLSGTVTVNQDGGYKNGVLYLVDGDTAEEIGKDSRSSRGDALLVPGKTYLFTSRLKADDNTYTIISHSNGRKLLSSDKNATASQLQALAAADTRVKALQEAYKNEVLLDVDVAANNTRNSYTSTVIPTTQKIK